jgi:hypothetical protein
MPPWMQWRLAQTLAQTPAPTVGASPAPQPG